MIPRRHLAHAFFICRYSCSFPFVSPRTQTTPHKVLHTCAVCLISNRVLELSQGPVPPIIGISVPKVVTHTPSQCATETTRYAYSTLSADFIIITPMHLQFDGARFPMYLEHDVLKLCSKHISTSWNLIAFSKK